MKVEYIRDMHNNYLVIKEENEANDIPSFQLKMVLNSNIDGVLPIKLQKINNLNHYYYDITSKQSMKTILETKHLNCMLMKQLVISIINSIEASREYLLKEEDFILDPEYIYIQYSDYKVYLCHKIGYQKNIKVQVKLLMEYLMDKVDYKDEKAVLLIYTLYKVSSEEGCTFKDLKNVLDSSVPEDKNNSNDNMEKEDNVENSKIDEEKSYKNVEERGLVSEKISLYTTPYHSDSIKQNKIFDTNKCKTKTTSKNTDKVVNKNKIEENLLKPKISYFNTIMKGKSKETKSKVKDKNSLFEINNIKSKKNNKATVNQIINKNKKNENDNKDKINMPLMLEKFQNEVEVESYSPKIYTLAISATIIMILLFITSLKSSIIYNPIGNKVDPTKLVGVLIILGSVEAYLLCKLFSDTNKETKIISSMEYVDMNSLNGDNEKINRINSNSTSNKIEEVANIQLVNHQLEDPNFKVIQISKYNCTEQLFEVESDEQTMLLADLKEEMNYKLIACNNTEYSDIELIEFPFFIGKLKTNVDYTLEHSAVSRFHLKIEKENENFYVTDLNSTNGTFLNDNKLEPNVKNYLKLGDELLIAHIKYRFDYETGKGKKL